VNGNSDAKRQSEFLHLVMDAARTGDDAALSEWWRRHYPECKLRVHFWQGFGRGATRGTGGDRTVIRKGLCIVASMVRRFIKETWPGLILALCIVVPVIAVVILYSMLSCRYGKEAIDRICINVLCMGGVVLLLVAAAPDLRKWYREAVEKCK